MASRIPPFGRGGGDPLVSIYREMNRMFDDVLGGALGGGRQPGALMPAPSLDVHERDNELCVSVELPGVKAGDVDVRLENDVLTISGEKRTQDEHKQANYHVTERSYGRFSRSMQLPFHPDPEQVRADFADGVLTIRLQRAQQQRSRRIEVRSGDASEQAGGGASASGTASSSASTASSDPGRHGGVEGGGDRPDAASSDAGGSGLPGGAGSAGSLSGSRQPAPRNDEAGYGVSAGAATEGVAGAGGGAMGSSGTEAGSSRDVGP